MVTLLLAGCGTNGSTTATNRSTATTTSPADSPIATPSGGFDLGLELSPGTYTSVVFSTPLTFTVPKGWKVFEDEIGQFGLARMANDGPCLCVWQDVLAAATSCAEKPEPGVGKSAKAIATWLSDLPALKRTTPKRVAVGGLKGYRLNTVMASDWNGTCSGVPTLVGSGVSTGVYSGVPTTGHGSGSIFLTCPAGETSPSTWRSAAASTLGINSHPPPP